MKAVAISFSVFFFAFVISPLTCNNAQAHVSADSMPDSVAEVEYSIYLEFKPNDIHVRNKLGMVYYRLNKMPEAVREFSRILKQVPDNYDALDGMGLVKAAQQEYDEAIELYKRAIALNPKDMVIYYHLGSALEKHGMLQEAAEAYQTALEKYNEKYPPDTDNTKAVKFAETIRTAIRQVETKL